MNAVRHFARLCALMFPLMSVGCSSDENSGNEPLGTGGGTSVATTTEAGSTGVLPETGGSSGANAGSGGQNSGGESAMVGGASSLSGAGSAGIGAAGTAGTGHSAGASALGNGAAGTGTIGIGAAGSTAIGTGAAGAAAGAVGTGQLHTISGAVTGLLGSGLSLSLGSGAPLAITADGPFAFPSGVESGTSLKVTVAVQPSAPRQTCTVSASGTAASLTHDVTDIAVTCKTNDYAIGGAVSGLLGSGLVLRSSSGEELEMGGNGRFAFTTKLPSLTAFTVEVKSQPTDPSQTCVVAGGSGTVGAADVSSISVNCSTNSYSIGGKVLGLEGSGLVLRNNDGDDVALSSNGSFAFSVPVASSQPFAVKVQTQPTTPAQTCVVVNGTGTVANAAVSNIQVTCTTDTYLVRGTVSGLAGAGLTLQNNLSDNLSITADGPFTFTTRQPSGARYDVTVQTQPTARTQTCTVTNASGTIGTSDVSVAVTCVTKQYTVGGSVLGLAGAGLVLRNNGADDLAVAADGNFTFASSVASGNGFEIVVHTQPAGQRCVVVGGKGTIGSANIASAIVNCSAESYTIGGTVTGLDGTGLELALNGTTILPIGSNGSFAFPKLLAPTEQYVVTLEQQPTNWWQTCTLTNATGTVSHADISDVAVSCTTNIYSVGGNVSGLLGTGLVLQNQGGDDLAVASDGSFAFQTGVLSGKPYSVTILTQPNSPTQTCVVTQAGGTVGGANIVNVQVTCTTNAYSIGGTITGLAGPLVLVNNGTDTLTVTANGTFTFGNPVDSGNAYGVTVVTNPTSPAQTCTVIGGFGSVGNANVANIKVNCVTREFTVGGTVTGLASGRQLVLRNNGGNDLTVTADGSFTFGTAVASGNPYAVTVLTNPTAQTCTVSGGTGTVGTSNVTSISVNCSDLHTVGGTITGLLGTGLVLRNGSETVSASGNGTFAFNTLFADGDGYNVTVQSQPTNPWQTCTVSGGTGTIAGNVTSVAVTCTSNRYAISVNVTGLVGTGLVLQNNNVDNLAIASSGVSTFANTVSSGQTYFVTVLTQPSAPNQTCTVTSATGSVTNAGVTVAVSCASNSFSIGGTVAGYVGTGLVLRNNGGNDLSISATGTFTFTNRVASGSSYAVTIASQPNGLTCGVSYGTGTVSNANVTSIRVNCFGYSFDSGTQGWTISNPPSGIPQPTWSSTEGNPSAGSLRVSLPFTSSNCQQINLMVPPPTVNATGTTLSVWVRFDAFPNNPASGVVQLYAQDANWGWNATQVQMSSFTLGTWRQITLPLPTSGNWTNIKALGIQVTPGSAANCQTATLFVDSVQLQ